MILKTAEDTCDQIAVTFRLPSTTWAESVHLVGDFNGWNRHSHPLKRVEDGSWEITLRLPKGRAYQFRYLVNDANWQNDWKADRYERNPFGGTNSVVET